MPGVLSELALVCYLHNFGLLHFFFFFSASKNMSKLIKIWKRKESIQIECARDFQNKSGKKRLKLKLKKKGKKKRFKDLNEGFVFVFVKSYEFIF